MLTNTIDNNLLEELINYEIPESNNKSAKKLQLLKLPRIDFSDENVHYDLNGNHLPKLHHGYFVQVKFFFVLIICNRDLSIVSFVNISNIV